jgi:hypothetical protein
MFALTLFFFRFGFFPFPPFPDFTPFRFGIVSPRFYATTRGA